MLGRSSKYHRPRGFFCLDGHCASCYLRIDGRPNRRACMTPVRDGLRCERQNAFPSADVDVLRAADWLFPEGMDHHTLMTGRRGSGNALFLKLVRQMGGSGTLPDEPAAAVSDTPELERADVCIVGGGPAGLAAARAFGEAAPRAACALFDEQAAFGGSLLAAPGGGARGAEMAAAARRAGRASGKRRDGDRVLSRGRRRRGVARRGDAGRTATNRRATLPLRHRRLRSEPAVRRQRSAGDRVGARLRPPGIPSRRAASATGPARARAGGDGGDRRGVAGERTCRAGVEVEVVDVAETGAADAGDRARVLGARGTQAVRAIEIERGGVTRETKVLSADLVAVAALPAPASELARQHGAEVAFDPARGGFAVAGRRGLPHARDRRLRVRRRHRLCRRRRGHSRRRGGGTSDRRRSECRGQTMSPCADRGRDRRCGASLAVPRLRRRRPRRRPPPRPRVPLTRAWSSRRSSWPRRSPRRPKLAPTRAERSGARSSTRPGSWCATSTTTRPWAASTGTPCARATSRWRWRRPATPRFTAR